MMYKIVLLLFVAVALADEDLKKCGKFFKPESSMCCKSFPKKEPSSGDLKDCFDVPMDPDSCERERCIAVKKGYLDGTDSFDKTIVTNYFQKNSEPEMAKNIVANCIEGDLTKYGPPHMCDLNRLHACVDMQGLALCSDWSTADECSGLKELAKECA